MKNNVPQEAEIYETEKKDHAITAFIDSREALQTAIALKGALNEVVLQWDSLFNKYRHLEQRINNSNSRISKLKERVETLEDLFEDLEPMENYEAPRSRRPGEPLRRNPAVT